MESKPDKETAPWIMELADKIFGLSVEARYRRGPEWGVVPIAKLIAVECRAPAPQPAETAKEWKVFSREAHAYLHGGVGALDYYYPICAEVPRHECIALVFGKTDEEALRRAESILRQHFVRVEATPQVTLCDHFWRTVPVNPKWSWFTECEKCKIGAPLELQAENYVEGTSEQAPQVTPTLHCYVTGNPCGTDTWTPDRPCACFNCQLFLRKTEASEQASTTPDTPKGTK